MPVLPVYCKPLETVGLDDFLSLYERTAKHHPHRSGNKLKYSKFCSLMSYYGMHPAAPIRIFVNEGIFEMAKNFSQIEFVECNLTSKDETALAKFCTGYENNTEKLLIEMLGDGYTVKVGFYPDSASFAAFLAPGSDTKQNKGKMLSSWSDSPSEAIFMCWYKHKVVLGGSEWDVDTNKSRWG
jgi:hypothetical protein